jgi:hypothetical protein
MVISKDRPSAASQITNSNSPFTNHQLFLQQAKHSRKEFIIDASSMQLLRQCVDALFQPVDLPLNSFEPFALVDLPPVFEYSNRVGLKA